MSVAHPVPAPALTGTSPWGSWQPTVCDPASPAASARPAWWSTRPTVSPPRPAPQSCSLGTSCPALHATPARSPKGQPEPGRHRPGLTGYEVSPCRACLTLPGCWEAGRGSHKDPSCVASETVNLGSSLRFPCVYMCFFLVLGWW